MESKANISERPATRCRCPSQRRHIRCNTQKYAKLSDRERLTNTISSGCNNCFDGPNQFANGILYRVRNTEDLSALSMEVYLTTIILLQHRYSLERSEQHHYATGCFNSLEITNAALSAEV